MMFSSMHFAASDLPGVIPLRIWSAKCAITAADSSLVHGFLTAVLDFDFEDAKTKEIQNKFEKKICFVKIVATCNQIEC